MLGFDKFFNRKVSAPVETQKSTGGGFNPSEKNASSGKEHSPSRSPKVRDKWVSPEGHILRITEWGNERGKAVYLSQNKAGDRDPMGGTEIFVGRNFFDTFKLFEPAPSKRAVIEPENTASGVKTGTSNVIQVDIKVEPDKTSGIEEFERYNTEIEKDLQRVEALNTQINKQIEEGSFYFLEGEWKDKLDTLVNELEEVLTRINNLMANDEVLDERVSQDGFQGKDLEEKKQNAVALSEMVQLLQEQPEKIRVYLEEAKKYTNKMREDNVVPLKTHPGYRATEEGNGGSVKDTSELSAEKEVKETEPSKDILEQLASERKELTQMMESHLRELMIRVEKGWITVDEERQTRTAYDKSDRALRRTLAQFKAGAFTLEDARKRLIAVQNGLPIEKMAIENQKSYAFFVSQEYGEAARAVIEKTLIEAMSMYFQSLGKKVRQRYKDSDWRKKALPTLEQHMLEYMHGIVTEEIVNRGALRMMLSRIAHESQ